MKTRRYFFLFPFLLVALWSCSTKKNKFINRNYHAVTTEFNVLYNGQLAFDKGIKELNENFSDDFWSRLSIEPIDFSGVTVQAPTFEEKQQNNSFFGFVGGDNNNQTKRATFERAESKAVKAVQKHSMPIYGTEKNPQIDEAYFLLGKSRYYLQRFIPAIEAFNYIIKKYPNANLIDETKIWKAKTNVRIENEDVAIEDLLELLEKENLKDDIIEKANTALALAYQKKDSTAGVIDRLQKSTKTKGDPVQKSRNLFVLGQIYAENNQIDSARITFKKLASYNKAPYRLKLEAAMAQAKIANNDSIITTLMNQYKKMIKNWDHRHHRDIIYYHFGTLEQKRDSIENAIESYNTAILFEKSRPKIKSYAYEKLADIYFDSREFVLSNSFYEEVLKIETQESVRQRRIKRRVENLKAAIEYESIIKKNDSILKIVLLNPEQRREYFQDYINTLKQADEEKAKSKQTKTTFGASLIGPTVSRKARTRGKWYFYNEQSLAFGASEFKRIWGNRKLVDNWRWSLELNTDKEDQGTAKNQLKKNKRKNRKNTKDQENEIEDIAKQYDIQEYLSKVLTDTKAIDSLQNERSRALYELGLIYTEKFEIYDLALERLERLLVSYPPKDLLLKTYYLLYELYDKQKESKGVVYGNKVTRKFPTSAYAQIIQDPNKVPTDKELENIRRVYKYSYNLYKEAKYKEAISFIDKVLESTLKSSKLVPKFELLRIYCTGKISSREIYKDQLKELYNRYPNSIEGRKALSIANKI